MLRFIDRFDVILLDLMGTFMFDGDRFSEDENYAATYRKLGGSNLSDQQVNSVISGVFRRMSVDYEDPNLYECFPPVKHYVAQVLAQSELPGGELDLLDEVFAIHETGVVPDESASIIHKLSRTHRLGVVSNIWCPSRRLLAGFDRSGISGAFEVAVFSSDYGINKPSPLLYGKALERLNADRAKVLFVGDSLRYDVAGAQAAGLTAVWIGGGQSVADGNSIHPDKTIGHLRDLLMA